MATAVRGRQLEVRVVAVQGTKSCHHKRRRSTTNVRVDLARFAALGTPTASCHPLPHSPPSRPSGSDMAEVERDRKASLAAKQLIRFYTVHQQQQTPLSTPPPIPAVTANVTQQRNTLTLSRQSLPARFQRLSRSQQTLIAQRKCECGLDLLNWPPIRRPS